MEGKKNAPSVAETLLCPSDALTVIRGLQRAETYPLLRDCVNVRGKRAAAKGEKTFLGSVLVEGDPGSFFLAYFVCNLVV